VRALTWIGHSTVLLELDGARLITDPVLRRRVGHLHRTAHQPYEPEAGALDAVLVSHLHYDHLDVASLRRLGRATRVVVPAGGARLLRKRGFRSVTEVEAGDEVRIADVAIRATPALHDGRRTPFSNGTPALGYLVSGSQRIYFAGDTDLFDDMRALAPQLDVALLPVGGWGSRLPPGHLDPARAVRAIQLLRPRIAVPIHWGTYRRIALVRDAALLRAPAERFAKLAATLAPNVDVRVLPVGGRLELAVSGVGIAS
jgi:L-ascorbate metabolism protein UlaG (beta-lactamase superfamily)